MREPAVHSTHTISLSISKRDETSVVPSVRNAPHSLCEKKNQIESAPWNSNTIYSLYIWTRTKLWLHALATLRFAQHRMRTVTMTTIIYKRVYWNDKFDAGFLDCRGEVESPPSLYHIQFQCICKHFIHCMHSCCTSRLVHIIIILDDKLIKLTVTQRLKGNLHNWQIKKNRLLLVITMTTIFPRNYDNMHHCKIWQQNVRRQIWR